MSRDLRWRCGCLFTFVVVDFAFLLLLLVIFLGYFVVVVHMHYLLSIIFLTKLLVTFVSSEFGETLRRGHG